MGYIHDSLCMVYDLFIAFILFRSIKVCLKPRRKFYTLSDVTDFYYDNDINKEENDNFEKKRSHFGRKTPVKIYFTIFSNP